VQRVEHHVSVRKGQAGRLERELAQAQVAAGCRGLKRRLDPNQLLVSTVRHTVVLQ